MSVSMNHCVGVILAGGKSRRMLGPEKSLMQLGSKPPVQWVADAMGEQLELVAVNANGDPKRFSFLGLPVIADTVADDLGPLAGVLAGMLWAQSQQATHIVTAATDTPFLPDDLVLQMVQRAEVSGSSEPTVVMASSAGRIHPVFGLWPAALAPALEDFLLKEDKRKILEFARRYNLREVEFSADPVDPFFNINSPADMDQATALLGDLT
ncbi:MAG: molybdenum cofactor guanylyltransferase MobA [Pseudomonadota bacterium]